MRVSAGDFSVLFAEILFEIPSVSFLMRFLAISSDFVKNSFHSLIVIRISVANPLEMFSNLSESAMHT